MFSFKQRRLAKQEAEAVKEIGSRIQEISKKAKRFDRGIRAMGEDERERITKAGFEAIQVDDGEGIEVAEITGDEEEQFYMLFATWTAKTKGKAKEQVTKAIEDSKDSSSPVVVDAKAVDDNPRPIKTDEELEREIQEAFQRLQNTPSPTRLRSA